MTHFTTTYAEFMSTFRDRITRYVAACPVAVSGEHGHDTTLKLAIALVHGFDAFARHGLGVHPSVEPEMHAPLV